LSELRNAAVRDYVYAAFFTGNATSKQTSRGRFRDLDQIARSIITEYKLDAIHDIGVSTAVTSLDLYRTLATAGIPFNFHISDKYAVYGSTGRCPTRIVDADGSVRELYLCGVLGKRAVSNMFPLTRFLHWLLADRPFDGPIRWFVLFDQEVLTHIEKGLMHRIDYDVFTTRMPCAFSFVRCMNLLNLCYFPRESIETALRNIIESLKEGGVLQIGRTLPDGTSHATFYAKRGTRFEVVHEVGSGTELREVIDNL
jgi:SAM-dependent methyltransferase